MAAASSMEPGEVAILAPVVTIRDGAAKADSRDIAKAFGKQHKDVLRKIGDLIEGLPHLNGRNFAPVEYPDEKGEMRRCYEMDRKGFSLVAMRFTGRKALAWQDAYTDAFDRMEQALAVGHGGAVMVSSIGPEARSTFGGIVKSVTHRELEDAVVNIVAPILDALVTSHLASHRFTLVEGVSALEVAEMMGFTKGKRPKGLSQYISGQMTRWSEDRKIPIRRVRNTKIYDECLAREWIRRGGRKDTENYISHRNGNQRQLRLVQPKPRDP
ncbi:MAG TPA: Rha family transcriptional regulator [Sphingomonas sp.]